MEKAQVETTIDQDVHIQLLGGFAVSVGNGTIPDEQWHSHRARSLVKLLALAPGCRLHRDQVIEALWSDSDFSAAINNFHQTLYNARRILETAGGVSLPLEEGFLSLSGSGGQELSVDIDRFEAAAARAKGSQDPQAYRDALDRYTGDLLPDDPYEEWTLPRREALRQVYLNLLLDLARLYETRQDYPAGIETLGLALACDRSHEEAHAGLMRLYALSGQRQQALRQYQVLRDALRAELDAEPGLAAQQLFQEIQNGRFSPALPPTPAARRHNLPSQLTSFIGREKQIGEIRRLVVDQRLVTLTGTGGTGKTRLALQVAQQLLDSFPDGVFLVELAPLSDPDLVPQTCVKALNVIEQPGVSHTEALVYFLEKKDLLLILDNCEHLINACANLADALLKGCPRLHILATSREILAIPGERPYRVPSLEVPDLHRFPELEQISQFEAVRLFVERTAQIQTGFLLTAENASAVTKICQRLDGIPLAIELAAARMRLLTAEQIASALEDAFHLLTGGGRTLLHRHQTLKALVDWSYDLLSPKERLLLQRLSVFAGGWTLEAAEAVCADETSEATRPEEQLASFEVLDLLAQLVDKSLVIAEPGAHETRYRMLETIRQYAQAQQVETGGSERVRDRHLAYFFQLAEQAEPHLRARGMMEWLERLDAELGNLRQALEWSLANDVESGLRLGASLGMFWWIRGYYLEGTARLEELLAAEEALNTAQPCPPHRRFARARALLAAAFLKLAAMMFPEGEGVLLARQARAIFAELGEPGQKWVIQCDFNLVTTEEEVQACLEACRRTGDKFTAGQCMMQLSHYRIQEFDPEGARAIIEELLALCREVGDMDGEAWALWRLGWICCFSGDLDRAVELWRASQACFTAVGNKEWIHFLSICLVRPLILKGEYRRAIEQLEALLAIGRAMRGIPSARNSLDLLAWAAWSLKDYDQVQRWVQELKHEGIEPWQYLMGRVAMSRGDYANARKYLEEYKSFGTGENAKAIQALGILAAVQQQERRAAVLFGALIRKCSWLKNISSPAEREEYEQALAAVRTKLGEEDFQTAWAEGQAMDLEQAADSIVSGLQVDGE